MHGLYLAANSLASSLKTFIEIDIKIDCVYIFSDTISQILSLEKSLSRFEPPFTKYLADIASQCYFLAENTHCKKEEIVYFIDQSCWFNPSDLLKKIDVLESHEVWLSKTRQLLTPEWLQVHPKYFLSDMIQRSEEAVSVQQTGGIKN